MQEGHIIKGVHSMKKTSDVPMSSSTVLMPVTSFVNAARCSILFAGSYVYVNFVYYF
jgi:hypothetical protein